MMMNINYYYTFEHLQEGMNEAFENTGLTYIDFIQKYN